MGERRKEYNQKPKNEGKTTNPPTRAQEKGENTDINQRIIEHCVPSSGVGAAVGWVGKTFEVSE